MVFFSSFFLPYVCCLTLCHTILCLAANSGWLSRAKVLPSWLLLDLKQNGKKKQKPPQNPKNIWQQGQHFKCRDTFFLDLCVISCSLKLLLGNGRSHRWSYHSFDLADPFKCQRQRHCKNPAPCKSGTAFGESCWFFWRAGNKAVSSFSLLFFWGTCKHLICVSFMRG